MDSPVRSATDEEKAVAIGVTVQVNLAEGRQLILQTALPRDASPADLNGLLDKLGKAADRQETRYRIPGLKAVRASHIKTRKSLEEDFERIEKQAAVEWQRKKKQGDPVLSPQETQHKINAGVNIKRLGEEIKKLDDEIAECEAAVAKDD
jgi:hypothetical protein